MLIILFTLLSTSPAFAQFPAWSQVHLSADPVAISELQAHCSERGEQWEIPASIHIETPTKEITQSSVGIRIHGDSSRCRIPFSFRMNFAKKYGSQNIPAAFLFPTLTGQMPDFSVKRNPDFLNIVGMRISKMIGAWTPEIEPILLYKNQDFQGPFVAAVKVNEKYLKRVLGRENFTLYEYKKGEQQEENKNLVQELKRQLLNLKQVTASEVSKVIDLRNFSLHMLSIAYLGNDDWRQGYLLKDHADGRRRWINWDFDHSFKDPASKNIPEIKALHRPRWAQEGMQLLVTGYRWWQPLPNFIRRPIGEWDLREALFYRLWREDVEFRRYFFDLANEVFERKVSVSEMLDVVTGFSEAAQTLDDVEQTNFMVMREFIPFRWQSYLKPQLEAMLTSPVTAPGSFRWDQKFQDDDFNFGLPEYIFIPKDQAP